MEESIVLGPSIASKTTFIVFCFLFLIFFPMNPLHNWAGLGGDSEWLTDINWPGDFIYFVVYWLFCDMCYLVGINRQCKVYCTCPFPYVHPQAASPISSSYSSSLYIYLWPTSPTLYHWPWICPSSDHFLFI